MNKVQQKNIQNLLKLIQENPYLRIVPLVDTECVPGDEFNSWVASWGQSRIEEICESINKERIYIKSEDYDDLVSQILGLSFDSVRK
jgi:hypothetical protein